MPVYDFNADYVPKNPVPTPLGVDKIPSVTQSSDSEGGPINNVNPSVADYPYHVEEFITPAFRSLDAAMKRYWSGIRVPTKDSFRFMRVKIAGGDKSLMIWADDLKEGRARMPLASISREGHEFNEEKFSPAHHAMGVRYLSSRGDRVAKIYRPVPYNVNYKMVVWTSSKSDAEYILYQSLIRFNPLAEFRMYDGKVAGNVQLKFQSSVDASDKEVGYDQYAKVRYELTMQAEAWLPLPEQIVPTVLGRVTSLREQSGSSLLSMIGDSIVTPST